MTRCEECGLPMPVCNALAFYMFAAKDLEAGDVAMAIRHAKVAREYYNEYRSGRAEGAENGRA